MTIRIAVVGAGFMGSAHARVLKRLVGEYPELLSLEYIIDIDYEKAKRTAKLYGGVPLENTNLLPKGSVDLAIVATTTKHHYRVLEMLSDKDVGAFLIEKPLSGSLSETLEAIKLIEEQGLWVSVGHIERFNPAVRALNRKTIEGMLGDIITTISRRVGPFTARVMETDVIYDLGVHEIDISLLLQGRLPAIVKGYTLKKLATELTDYALITLGYTGSFSSIEVNRVTPFKQRIMHVTGTKAAAFLDYITQELKVYTNEYEINVRIKRDEPLYIEDKDVVNALREKRNPPIDVYQAFISILLCEESFRSASEKREIELDYTYNRFKDLVSKGVSNLAKYLDYVSSLK